MSAKRAGEESKQYLEEMRRQRGYVMDFHRIMANQDLEWTKAYDQFVRATYTNQRTLDRKTKELVQTAVLAALRSEPEHIRIHVRLAMEHGASKEQVLEALQCVYAPMGALGFRAGLLAWAAETGAKVE